MLPSVVFIQQVRTPSSEVWIVDESRTRREQLAQIDIHYPSSGVDVTVALLRPLSNSDLASLLAYIDSELISSADAADGNLRFRVIHGGIKISTRYMVLIMRTILAALLSMMLGCGDAPKPSTAAKSVDPPKEAPKPRPKEHESQPQSSPKKIPAPPVPAPSPPTFEEAIEWVSARGEALKKEIDGELETKKKRLTEDELLVFDAIMGKPFTGVDLANVDVDRFLRKNGFEKLIWYKAIEYAVDEKRTFFRQLAKLAWDHSTKTRLKGKEWLLNMAIDWGSIDDVRGRGIFQIMQDVVSKSREITAEERDVIVKLVGEEFWLNRP